MQQAFRNIPIYSIKMEMMKDMNVNELLVTVR
jgi:hypothetical protein